MKRSSNRIKRPSRGFTLIEVLVALALVAAMSGLMLTAIQGLARARSVANQQITNMAVIGTQSVLRRILAEAVPSTVALGAQATTGGVVGESNRLRLITQFAGGGQFAGAYLTTISIVARSGPRVGFDLIIEQVVWRDPGAGPTGPRVQTVVLPDVKSISVRYFGASAPGAAPTWRTTWSADASLPLLVAIDVAFPDADARTWPQLIIAPRQQGD